MTAHDDDNGASLQPNDPLPDGAAFFRALTVGCCIGAAVWLVLIALGMGWWR